MTHKVNIEIMVDTNANSRKIDGQYDDLRDMVEQQESGSQRAIREFRDYLSKAKRAGVQYDVTQRDTAQIFHEKTNLMTPELAAEAGITIKPDFVRTNLEEGHYRVEPPVHGEEEYYDALTKFLKKILPEKAPQDLSKLEAMTPENRGLVLQGMYQDHMMGLPGKFRNGAYKKDFDEYRETRFNAGEVTAINFLRNHPLPADGERTAFIFVGSDNWANEEMAKARQGKDDEGKFEVFVVPPQQFRQMMEQVIRDIEKENPDMRELRKSYRELAEIEPAVPNLKYSARMQGEEAPKPEASPTAKAFSSFVTRVENDNRNTSISR